MIAFLYYHKILIKEKYIVFSNLAPPATCQPGALGGCLGRLCQEPALSTWHQLLVMNEQQKRWLRSVC